MTAREFLDGYRFDQRLITGDFYSQQPVAVEPGDRVGVVLMNFGGPECLNDVEAFLFNRFMDPAVVTIPLPAFLRERLCRLLARKRAVAARKGYEQIGGTSPLNRHTRDQAEALKARLNERFGPVTGATFTTYVAMRYWQPTSTDAAAQMQADGVTKVVLLPLHPQYSKTTTGSSLAYWKTHEETSTIPSWPTSYVNEYSTHPKLVQALSERIDEGLQRFPEHVRERVHLVFTAPGISQKAMQKQRDPYCCLVHSTVQQVIDYRKTHETGRAFHVAFQESLGPAKSLSPSTSDTLEELAENGHTAVLVIPVALVSDHIETAYVLDIAMREEAMGLGIEHYEVTSGLNCHPLLIETLAECVAAQIAAPKVAQGDGADVIPAAIPLLPRYAASERAARCGQCPFITEAHDWSDQPAVRVPAPRAADPVLVQKAA